MGVICADLGALTTARAYSEQKQTFYVIAYVSSTFSLLLVFVVGRQPYCVPWRKPFIARCGL